MTVQPDRDAVTDTRRRSAASASIKSRDRIFSSAMEASRPRCLTEMSKGSLKRVEGFKGGLGRAKRLVTSPSADQFPKGNDLLELQPLAGEATAQDFGAHV